MKLNTKLLASFVLWGVSVNAWGPLGHSTVAAVALQYLKPETLERTRTILCHEGLAEETLVTVANWADSYKRTREGSYSYDHHFIDAEDEPLAGNCHVDMKRDCSPKGCIVTAIANYTRRASDETLNIAQNAEALRFLTHFFGDLHQPLHAEGIKKAGNHIPVLFNGKQSNLHRAWDVDKIQALFGDYTIKKAHTWAKIISREVDRKGGIYHEKAKRWLDCQDLAHPAACALKWAKESNRLNCEFVFVKDPTGKELNDGFYPDWMLFIEQQIAQGGIRLAAWLNLMFAGSTGFDTMAAMTVMEDGASIRDNHVRDDLR
ncbi:hypothetical protein FRB94_008520 [Tulasnella sp. JGI-2019a]|nr:hypothetical protein FRB94_008520 [Tulasnella sp. JGI-2019a]KAG8999377.1 hypothetical protein FRB93_013256 [Tulasnella sp. JGI-2019a]